MSHRKIQQDTELPWQLCSQLDNSCPWSVCRRPRTQNLCTRPPGRSSQFHTLQPSRSRSPQDSSSPVPRRGRGRPLSHKRSRPDTGFRSALCSQLGNSCPRSLCRRPRKTRWRMRPQGRSIRRRRTRRLSSRSQRGSRIPPRHMKQGEPRAPRMSTLACTRRPHLTRTQLGSSSPGRTYTRRRTRWMSTWTLPRSFQSCPRRTARPSPIRRRPGTNSRPRRTRTAPRCRPCSSCPAGMPRRWQWTIRRRSRTRQRTCRRRRSFRSRTCSRLRSTRSTPRCRACRPTRRSVRGTTCPRSHTPRVAQRYLVRTRSGCARVTAVPIENQEASSHAHQSTPQTRNSIITFSCAADANTPQDTSPASHMRTHASRGRTRNSTLCRASSRKEKYQECANERNAVKEGRQTKRAGRTQRMQPRDAPVQ